jgi:hypothetical protein
MRRALLSFLLGASLLSADTLVLRNGTRVDGSFLGGDARNVRFAVGDKVNTYHLYDIQSIDFLSGSPSDSSSNGALPPNNPPPNNPPPNYPPPNNPPPNYPPPNASAADNRPRDSYPAPAGPPPSNGTRNGWAGMEIPAGTVVVVRLIDPVNSETDSLGQTYRASVDQPVLVNGQTVIPRGADAVATLVDAQKSGRIEGKTVMTLDLKSLTVNGRTYDISTEGVSQASDSRGARSTKVIGGTAALGAILGAIAGGGRGAAIGTLAGAGAGTAAQVATSGQKVKVPAETRLTFTLQNPLDL